MAPWNYKKLKHRFNQNNILYTAAQYCIAIHPEKTRCILHFYKNANGYTFFFRYGLRDIKISQELKKFLHPIISFRFISC